MKHIKNHPLNSNESNTNEDFTYRLEENHNDYTIIKEYSSGFEEYVIKVNKISLNKFNNAEEMANKILSFLEQNKL